MGPLSDSKKSEDHETVPSNNMVKQAIIFLPLQVRGTDKMSETRQFSSLDGTIVFRQYRSWVRCVIMVLKMGLSEESCTIVMGRWLLGHHS